MSFKLLTALTALATVLFSANAQSAGYGQCGGTGWTGATTCVSGFTCTYSNAYYSQCLPGSATTTSKPTTGTTSSPPPTTTSSPPPSSGGTVITGPTSCTPAGSFTLCQNLWGRASGTGSQNSTLISASGNTVSWSTAYTWANGPNSVKSYANVQSNTAQGIQLSALKTAPTTWNWNYQTVSSGIRADVSYDIWLGKASSGAPASTASSYEIMIWLSGQGGIQPVGSSIQTGISLAGHTWTLWSGPNTNWNVFSFVSANGDITNFSADLKVFFDFLVQQHGVASSQYIQAIQSGTEPFTGSANLVTSSYSVSAS